MEPLNHLLSNRSEEFLGHNPVGTSSPAPSAPAAPSYPDREEQLRTYIAQIESLLGKLKALVQSVGPSPAVFSAYTRGPEPVKEKEEIPEVTGEVSHEGVFNGELMISSDGNTYPIPANYASKSKLVEGDLLKVIIAPDGHLLFKQIGPIERERKIGDLTLDEDGSYQVHVDMRSYRVLPAAVTYHKGRHGEKAVILVPKDTPSTWAAVEYIIHN